MVLQDLKSRKIHIEKEKVKIKKQKEIRLKKES
jgi:hypothetical protein